MAKQHVQTFIEQETVQALKEIYHTGSAYKALQHAAEDLVTMMCRARGENEKSD